MEPWTAVALNDSTISVGRGDRAEFYIRANPHAKGTIVVQTGLKAVGTAVADALTEQFRAHESAFPGCHKGGLGCDCGRYERG